MDIVYRVTFINQLRSTCTNIVMICRHRSKTYGFEPSMYLCMYIRLRKTGDQQDKINEMIVKIKLEEITNLEQQVNGI